MQDWQKSSQIPKSTPLMRIPNRLSYSLMKPGSFLITKNQHSNSSNRCCKLLNTTTQAEGHWEQHGKDLPAEIRTEKQNSLQKTRQLWQTHRKHCTNFTSQQWCHQELAHLLQRIHPPCQHVQVVKGGDGGGQVTLGMIQLLDIPGDFLHLENEKGFWLKIKPQQWHFQEIKSHSLLFGIAEVSALQPCEHYRLNGKSPTSQDQGQKCYWQEKSVSPPFQRPEIKCCSPFVPIFQPCL